MRKAKVKNNPSRAKGAPGREAPARDKAWLASGIPVVCLNNSQIGLLGFARRARQLFTGFEAVRRAVQKGQAGVVLLSEDVGQDSLKKVKFLTQSHGVPLYIMSDKSEWREKTGLFGYKILALKRGPMSAGFKKNLTVECS